MQFKNPEILYFLMLLIIPIIVHLFQLQKFVKVSFTNVAFLQKLVLQTRRSSKVKKWLILTTRILGLLAIVFAFSQPYLSNTIESNIQHNFIYLDNSISTDTKGEKGNLLQIASQEIIENSSTRDNFSLLTNDNFYANVSSSELKNILLSVKHTAKSLAIDDVFLKIESQIKNDSKTLNKNILISDFQNITTNDFTNVNRAVSLIPLQNSLQNNLSVDSVWVNEHNDSNYIIKIVIKNQGGAKNNIPIAIFNNEMLISKQTFSIEENAEKKIEFSIQKKSYFLGKIQITFSDTFNFDNTMFFTINANEKINVLSIGKNNSFLSKIFTKNEFSFTKYSAKKINYNAILKQQLIILNELVDIPQALLSSLSEFTQKGGHLIIIPSTSANINSYNLFLKTLSVGKILSKELDTLKITKINFNHPLLKNVFVKQVKNFQYPQVNSHFSTQFNSASAVISYEDNSPFIQKIKTNNFTAYFVSSSLEKQNSNFINSPLVVPTFYTMGKQSLQHSVPYYRVGYTNHIDVNTSLNKDEILIINHKKSSFIPLQQTFQNKVALTTKEQPTEAGFYSILKQQDTLKHIAYNYAKEESLLQFLKMDELKNHKKITTYSSVKDVFLEIKQKNKVHWLWQWFLALAIVSLLLEILILKFFKA